MNSSKTRVEQDESLDLNQLWAESQAEFQKISGCDPNKLTVVTVEHVIGKINQKMESDAKGGGAKYRKAKDVLSKTLICIDNLGKIASQGLSMVFGPSTLCFNAVSYLISTAQNYSKIFAGVADLFDRISAFLSRFEVYVRTQTQGLQLDMRLKRIIHELLRSFVRICALSIKISKEPRIFLMLEVFSFGTDKGVQAELDRLETLVQREVGMSVALILESAKVVESRTAVGFAETKGSLKNLDGKMDGISGQIGGVAGVLERQENAEKRKEQENMAKKNQERIRKALKIDQEVKQTWRSDYEEFVRNRVPKTGQWLMNDSSFSTWADIQAESDSIFALEATEGYGKSFLCSMVVKHLHNLYPPGRQDPRVSVAYYFFEKDNKDSKSVNKALRALVWQLTENDPVYQKSVAGACNNPAEFAESLELWKLLFLNLSKMDATFFLVLDAIDEAETENGRPLLRILRDVLEMTNSKGQLCIRLFLAGRPKAFGEIERDANISVPRLRLGTRNEDDIRKYVENKMDNMDILKKSSKPDIQELRDRICTVLMQGAQGDFVKLGYKLAEINTKRRPKEIEEVLEYAGEDRQDTIAREVERLNQTLGQEDIQDLNELLAWIIGANVWPSLLQLEGVLLVKNDETSLMPLKDQIQDKFAALLEVSNDNVVTFRSDSIIDYFRKKSQAAEDPVSGAVADLHHSEVALVRRILKLICEDELFNKFGFEEFFRQKLGKRANLIHVDMEDLQVKIITRCLEAICGPERVEMKELLDYAFYWLPDHLDEVKDLSLTGPAPKTKIGSLLIKLFVEEEFINRWWTGERMYMRTWWILDDRYANIVLRWFKDSAVVKGLPGNLKEWLNDLTSNSKPEEDLMKPITVVMARRWLQSGDWYVIDILWWILGYITKIGNRRDNSERVISDDDDTTPSLAQIIDAEKWAKAELKVEEPDSLWSVQMAITFRRCGLYEQAIERCRTALQLDALNWRADFCIAQTYALQGDYKHALEDLERIVQVFRASDDLMQKYHDIFHDDIIVYLAEWNWELKQYHAAYDTFSQILEANPDNYEVAFKMIELLKLQGKYVEIFDFLDAMNNKIDDNGLPRLIAMYHMFSSRQPYHETISFAAQRVSNIKAIKDAYQNAIAAAKEDNSKLDILAGLRYWYGLFLFYHHETEQDRDEALNIWEENIGMPVTDQSVRFIRSNTAKKLAFAYLQLAKQAELDSQAAVQYLKRLAVLSSRNSDDDRVQMSNIDTNLLLGRLYRLMRYEDKARECLKDHIKVSLDLLSDDDPENDWQGYVKLAETLSCFDDDANALAAWCLIGPLEQEEEGQSDRGTNDAVEGPEKDAEAGANPADGIDKQGSDISAADNAAAKAPTEEGLTNNTEAAAHTAKSRDDTNKKDQEDDHGCAQDNGEAPVDGAASPTAEPRRGPLACYCDGSCGHTWSFADDIYACKDCIDVQFEQGCLVKLRNGTLERWICGKNHEFLHVPKWDEAEWKRIPKGMMKVGDKVVTVKNWLNDLRRVWGFEAVE